MLFGRDRGRLEPDQRQALDHPIRLRILELFTKDTDRPMTAESLAADLMTTFPKVKVGQVAYHVAVLKDAHLLPTG